MTSTLTRALVLAGRRSDAEPVAGETRQSHKALTPVAGAPMALRVLRALAGAGAPIGRIGVSCDDPAVVLTLSELATAEKLGVELDFHPSAASPAASVEAYVGTLPVGELALITTADHPLLSAEIVAGFVELALAKHADFVAGAVAEDVYRARFPAGPRTFVRLADVAFSGANLFLARAPGAEAVAHFWRRVEKDRKHPWRLVSHFGTANLLSFLFGRLGLEGAVQAASARIGASVAVVLLPYAEAALDVDRPADLSIVEGILADSGAASAG